VCLGNAIHGHDADRPRCHHHHQHRTFLLPCDSGQFGWIYAGPEQCEKMGTPADRIEEVLQAEVQEYDLFLRGEVYGWTSRTFP
jgi:hypothetical protein